MAASWSRTDTTTGCCASGGTGTITQLIGVGNIVPTGLAISGNTVYMAEAGPVPHHPEDGKIVSFEPGSATVSEVASGARLAVDVEMGRGQTLFALAQGHFSVDNPECAGAPATRHRSAHEGERRDVHDPR